MLKRTLPLWLAILLYCAAALPQLDLPGLHHDEAQEAGLMAMQIEAGLPVTFFRGAHVVAGGRGWPLMVQDYIGSLNVYLAWVAFAIGGVSVESLRVMAVLTGVVTLITAYGAAHQVAGRQAAALTALLLALHPTYIFWTRQGVFVTSYTLTLALAALWLLAAWWKAQSRPGDWRLWLAAFLMGVGLWGKLLFIWFILGLLAAWGLLNLPRLWEWLRGKASLRPHSQTRWYVLPVGILCGLIGMLPLIEYNLQTGGTFDNIFNNLDQSYYGVDNSDVGANFQTRVRQAPEVFESGHLWELGGLYPNPVARAWLYLSGVACLIAAWRYREKRGARLFIVCLFSLMLGQTSFTSTALWFTHFALLLPFMVMSGAIGMLALSDLLRPFIGRGGAAALLALMLALHLSYEGVSLVQYHQALARTGGIGPQSAALYPLVEQMEALPPGAPVAALDWGVSPAVEMLTEGRIVPNEVFGYSWEVDSGFSARLAPFIALDESLYIMHAESATVFPRREAFFQQASAAGKTPVLITSIPGRDGNPYFEIWQLTPAQ